MAPQEKSKTDLGYIINQMKSDFASILDIIFSGRPLVVCSKSREDTELYAQTLAKIRPSVEVISWTENEELLFSLNTQDNIIVGSPLRYLMKITETGIPTINLVFYRLHSEDVESTDRWKDVAKYASKKFGEMGEDEIYAYLQAQMKDEVSYACPDCGGPVTIRKISLNKFQFLCENKNCGKTWTE